MNTVGERLKILRDGMGLSQKKMAELLDVTQPSINRYEHGKAVPIEVLIGYADYFDVSYRKTFLTGYRPKWRKTRKPRLVTRLRRLSADNQIVLRVLWSLSLWRKRHQPHRSCPPLLQVRFGKKEAQGMPQKAG